MMIPSSERAGSRIPATGSPVLVRAVRSPFEFRDLPFFPALYGETVHEATERIFGSAARVVGGLAVDKEPHPRVPTVGFLRGGGGLFSVVASSEEPPPLPLVALYHWSSERPPDEDEVRRVLGADVYTVRSRRDEAEVPDDERLLGYVTWTGCQRDWLVWEAFPLFVREAPAAKPPAGERDPVHDALAAILAARTRRQIAWDAMAGKQELDLDAAVEAYQEALAAEIGACADFRTVLRRARIVLDTGPYELSERAEPRP